ncbi:hypothetical protein BDZ94DRAFT_1240883 [Collybia nuda]|uniref:Uncharacterized protein n=1 Tax=Collybia nuda TaxID=64659 RepID=A0A9P5XVF2_9AGAR|nr:hypothetical protein BDZ94DRAFT_1240883 [Collybia nuda]
MGVEWTYEGGCYGKAPFFLINCSSWTSVNNNDVKSPFFKERVTKWGIMTEPEVKMTKPEVRDIGHWLSINSDESEIKEMSQLKIRGEAGVACEDMGMGSWFPVLGKEWVVEGGSSQDHFVAGRGDGLTIRVPVKVAWQMAG